MWGAPVRVRRLGVGRIGKSAEVRKLYEWKNRSVTVKDQLQLKISYS